MARKRERKRALDDALTGTPAFSELAELDELEDTPRRFAGADDDDEEQQRLPIIVNGQVVKRRRVSTPKAGSGSDSDDSGDSDDDGSGSADADAGNDADAGERIEEVHGRELKERIALFADLVSASPEEHLDKLRELLRMCEQTRRTSSRQLLLVSLLQVFKGIVPGYAIKELTEQQMKEKLSKEVRELRDFEQGLLACYRRFVRLVGHSFRSTKGATAGATGSGGSGGSGGTRNQQLLNATAVEVCCDLVEALPHFNFRHELVVLVAERLASKRVDASFLRCTACLALVFQQDVEGTVSFEAVQAICRMVKARRYKVDSRVLGVFVHLRLLTELQGRADLERLVKNRPPSAESVMGLKRRERVHLTKTQRKARKEQREIDEQMRKAELGVSAKVRERLQAQTLKLVFVVYMNVLKLRARTLLGVTLEGLAKFAHLINSELYGDLLEVLREILTTDQQQSTRQSLLCILTAFQLLRGQGHEKSTDLGFFVDELFKTLNAMALSANIESSHRSLQSSHAGKFASETDMLVSCLEFLFLKRRAVSRVRLLAFAKRLAECSLQFPERSSMIALKALREMVKHNPDAAALLQTHDRVGRGVYNFEALVPEQANAEVATLWELALLKSHYDPRVQEAARLK